MYNIIRKNKKKGGIYMTVSIIGFLTSNFCKCIYILILANLLLNSEYKFTQNLSFIAYAISFCFFLFTVHDVILYVQFAVVDTINVTNQVGVDIANRYGINELKEAMNTLNTAFY